MSGNKLLSVPEKVESSSENSSIPDMCARSPMIHATPGSEWKKEKTCFICNAPLGRGFTKTKKKECRFCGHAVCSECSHEKCFHPESQKLQRICSSCNSSFSGDRLSFVAPAPLQANLDEVEAELRLETALKQSFECKLTVAECKLQVAAQEIDFLKSRISDLESASDHERTVNTDLSAALEGISKIVLGETSNSEFQDWTEAAGEIEERIAALQRGPDRCDKGEMTFLPGLSAQSFGDISIVGEPGKEQRKSLSHSTQIESREKLQLDLTPTISLSIPGEEPDPPVERHMSCSIHEEVGVCGEEKCVKCGKLEAENETLKLLLKKAEEAQKGKSVREIRSMAGARVDNACKCVVF